MATQSFSWVLWAMLSAVFAAMTAILAKVGVESIDADLATFVRTVVILLLVGGIALVGGHLRELPQIPPRSLLFLVLSGLATGASWLCYFRALKIGEASRVAPVDKMSVVLVGLFGVMFLGEKLSRTHWLGLLLIAGGVFLMTRKG